MEPASSLIDLTLPVAPSSTETSVMTDPATSTNTTSPRVQRRQSLMTPLPGTTDTTHTEDGDGSPSRGLSRGGVGAGEQGEATGQVNSSASDQQEEVSAGLPLRVGAVDDAAVDDAAVDDAAEENVTSESGGDRPTEDVASRGHGRHAPLPSAVGGQTAAGTAAATAAAAAATTSSAAAQAAPAAEVATTDGVEEQETGEAPVQPLGDSTNTTAGAATGAGVGVEVVVVEAVARPAPTSEEGGGAVKRPKKKRKKETAAGSDGERCSVCLDPWTSKGKHRICTLLCGHLFGQSCIERWLKERRSCPQCGAKVGPKGSTRVIPLFLQNLVATDTGELETLRSALDEEKRLRKQSERESVQLSIRNASLEDQLSRFRRQQQLQQQQQHKRKQQQQQPVPLAAADGVVSNSRGQRGGGGVGNGQGGGCGYPILACGSQATLTACLTPGPACLTRRPSSTALERILLSPPPQRASVSRLLSPPPPSPSSLSLSPSRGDSRTADVGAGNEGGGGGGSGGGGGEGGAGVVDGGDGEPLSSHAAASSSRGNSSSSSSSNSLRSIDSSSIGSSSISSGIRGGFKGGSNGKRGREVRFERLFSKGVREGRVAAFAGGTAGALLVSQEFGEAGGPRGSASHGVTKFSLADLRHHKSIRLHRAQVRDVKFSSNAGGAGYILTTSFDRTLKVCDVRTDSVVVEYGLEGNGWSCQWSATNPGQMFCGVVDSTRTAAVLLFDLRSTKGAVRKLRAAAKQRQPVHGICHTENDRLVCATMGGVWGWEGGTTGGEVAVDTVGGGSGGGGVEQQQEQTATRLQIQPGACCSLSHHSGSGGYERSSDAAPNCFLVSTRGSAASHTVFGLETPRNRHHHRPLSPIPRPRRLCDGEGSVITDPERVDADKALQAATAVEVEVITVGGGSGKEGEAEVTTAVPAAAVGGGSSEERGRDGGEGGRRPGLYPPRFGEVAGLRAWTEGWTPKSLGSRGHQSQHTLSRSLLWDPSLRGDLLIAGGDEGTNAPWIWDASSGDVCRRLEAHSSPVLDVASLQRGAPGKGLFAAVSRGEMRVYETSLL